MLTLHKLVESLYHGFDEDFLAVPGGKVPIPDLYSVQIMHSVNDGPERYVGLDETEFILPPGNPRNPLQNVMREGEVWVYGVLRVESVDRLSEKGIKLLERKIQERDNEGRNTTTFGKRLTLSQLLAQGMQPSIVVRFKKRSQVLWPDDKHHQFLVQSVEHRKFSLKTMHIETYRRSENWFHRQQMVRLMKQLVRDASPQQPIEARTAKWFMDQYRVQIHPQDLRKRIIFHRGNGETADIDIYGSLARDRFLRRLEEGDLTARFGEQCEWLLANHISSTSAQVKLFNVEEWVGFCRYVQKNRVRSWEQADTRWAIPPNVESPYDLVFDDDEFGMERFGGKKEEWKKNLENSLKKKPPPKPKAPEPPLAFSPPRQKKRKRPPPEQAIYDSDFSEPSTSGESDSEDEPCARHTLSCLSLQTPVMPTNRRYWDCPHRDPPCSFRINMVELYEKLDIKPVRWASDTKVRSDFEKEFLQLATRHEVEVHIPIAFLVDEEGKVRHRGKEEQSRLRRSTRKRTARIKSEY